MIPNPPFHIQQFATFVIAAASGGKVAFDEVDGCVGSFDGRVTGLRGLSDDVVVTGQGGERHELGGTVMHAHMGMRLRLLRLQSDDVGVAMGFRKALAS